MITLQISQEKANKLDETENLALDIIHDALKGDIEADTEQVKIATKMLSVVAKNRQTMTNRSAIEFGMATSVANEKELRNYIEATNPTVQKALGGKLN